MKTAVARRSPKTAKLPAPTAPGPTGYRIARVTATGKIVAVADEILTLSESQALGDEFGLDILAAGSIVKPGTRKMTLRQPVLDRLQELRNPKPNARSVFSKEWIVVNDGLEIHRGTSCPDAVKFIDKQGLQSSCLFSCQEMMAEMLRDMLPSPQTSSPRPPRPKLSKAKS